MGDETGQAAAGFMQRDLGGKILVAGSLTTKFLTPFAGRSVSANFSGHKLRPSLNPVSFPRPKEMDPAKNQNGVK
nr:hypothetical protein CFP56_47757 [Quercus suber]